MNNLLNTKPYKELSSNVRNFLYDLIVVQKDTTDEDIESYFEYEAHNDPEARKLMEETIKACKMYKMQLLLLQEDPPHVSEIIFKVDKNFDKLTPDVKIERFNPSVSAYNPDHNDGDAP